MTRRTLRYLIELISVIWMSTALRFAIGATATALVSVTILAPSTNGTGLTLSSSELDMLGKSSEELTIFNHSSSWREIRVYLVPQNGTAVCNLHYSPMRTSIPPGGLQVVRLLNRDQQHTCQTDYRIIITEAYARQEQLFDVPVRTAQNGLPAEPVL